MKLTTGSDIVDQMQEVHFEGNVTPHTWYRNILLKSGKPDLIGITILGDISYWYRPSYVYDDTTGQLKGIKKKFKADLLQRSYEAFEIRFGFSKKQIREAFDRLEEIEVVRRHFRTIPTGNGVLANNVLFIELDVERIKDLTYSIGDNTDPIDLQGNSLLPHRETAYCPTGKDPIDLEGNTNTKITTKITKELTTTTKSAESHNGFSPEDGVDRLANRFIELRAKGLQLSANDYTSIGRTLQVVPEEDAIHYLETCFRERTDAKITTFSYCEQYIVDSHQRNLARLKAKEQAKQTTSVESSVYKPDSMAYKLASHLLTKNKEDDPGYPAPNLQAWSLEMDRLLQEDKRSATDVKNYIDWCKADPHWKTRVENPKELRRNFSKLVAAKKSEKSKSSSRRNHHVAKNPKWLEKEKQEKVRVVLGDESSKMDGHATKEDKQEQILSEPVNTPQEANVELTQEQRFEKMMEELQARKKEKGEL